MNVQLQLFDKNEVKPTKRPTTYSLSDEDARVIAEGLFKKMLKRHVVETDVSSQEQEEIIQQLILICKNHDQHSSTHELIKEFENIYWEITDELIDFCHGYGHNHYILFSENIISRWIAENDIKPTFAVGDSVTFNLSALLDKNNYEGTITGFDEKNAKYLIKSESYDENRGYKNTSSVKYLGVYIPYENVHGDENSKLIKENK